MHVNIFCDLCMDQIRGQWFHCVYCPRDLCGHCEEVDEHDRSHFSMVAKAPVCIRLHPILRLKGFEQTFIDGHDQVLSLHRNVCRRR
jgi:hypothetical protein